MSVAFFGEGATNEGAFHEALNMAAIWQLPAVFVCENNLYAASTPVAVAFRSDSVADRAAAYGLPGEIVDGNDVLAVHEVAGRAIDARALGRRPDAARMHDLSPVRSFAQRPAHLPHQGRGRGMGRPRSHQALGEHLLAQGLATQTVLDEVEKDVTARWMTPSPLPRPALRRSRRMLAARVLGRGCAMTQMSIAEALRQAIREEMRRDERVFCIGEDIGIPGGFGGAFTVTLGLSDEFGHERILDTPISELGLTGIAVGAAMAGLAAHRRRAVRRLPVPGDGSARQRSRQDDLHVGRHGESAAGDARAGRRHGRGAQHAQSLEAFFCHIPGLKVVAPATAYDAKGLLKSAVRDDNPVIVFEHKLLYGSKGPRTEKGALSPVGEVPDEDYLVPIGKGIIRRAGKDVTIVGKLLTMYRALAAAEALAKDGIEAEVIDPRTLVPLDKELILESVRKTGRLVIVEEDNLTGGWAGEIAAIVAEEAFYWLDAPIKRVSAPDVPPPFAPVMEQFYVPSAERVVAAVKALF